MEKIRINNNEFELVPMGVTENDKKRTLKLTSNKTSVEIEEIFSDVSKISLILEDGTEKTWLDGVKTTAITNHLDGTYTVEISTDAVERRIAELQAEIQALKGE